MNTAKKSASFLNAQTLVLVCVTVALAAFLVQLEVMAGGNSNSRLLAEELRPTFQSAREYRLISLADTIEKLAVDQVALRGALSGLHEEMNGDLGLLVIKRHKEEIVGMEFFSPTESSIACDNIEQLRTARGVILTEYRKGLPASAQVDGSKQAEVLKVYYWTCRVQ
ncbi:MAG TPA: hypothetical protein PLC15_02255 [Candidatus Obscuribacter sp.]|nr:hypothetical protein [Candidatus Obscuribacter sp.]HMY01995.1 hypothetical protein [Candidatus Obscuribacter sp.]HMY52526.1 hypothetical protein [Candidatus Obscuribacter sp.]HNB14170.1 hypothetical protein [Candidatus Obscuribacter sp.]